MKPILSIGANSITAIFNLSKPPLTMKIGSIGWDMALEAVKTQNWHPMHQKRHRREQIKCTWKNIEKRLKRSKWL